MILDDIHEVHHVGHKGATREPMHGSQHGTSIDDDSIPGWGQSNFENAGLNEAEPVKKTLVIQTIPVGHL